MFKKIAVLVRGRQGEALRMALGLTLVDDKIDVYFLDEKTKLTEQDALNLELMQEMEVNFYSSNAMKEGAECLPLSEIARRLTQYDHVLPY